MSDEEWLDDLLGLEDGEVADGSSDADFTEEELRELRQALRSMEAELGWQMDGNAVLAYGRRDNALQAEGTGIVADYLQLEIDGFAILPRKGMGWELLGLGYAELRRWDGVPGLSSESLALLRLAASKGLSEGIVAEALVEGVYSDQAFDASENEFETEVVSVKGTLPEISLGLRWSLDTVSQLQWRSGFGLTRYDQDEEDRDRWKHAITYYRNLTDRGRFEVGLARTAFAFDEKLARNANGVRRTEILQTVRTEFSGTLRWRFGKEQKVKSSTRLRWNADAENAGDYYGRSDWRLRQSLEFPLVGWRWMLASEFGERNYDGRQTRFVGGELRRDESHTVRIEVDRALGEGPWKLFLRGSWEEKRSNALGFSYDSLDFRIGMRVSGANYE